LLPCFFFSGRRRHTIFSRDWSSDVCSSDLDFGERAEHVVAILTYEGWQAHFGGRDDVLGSLVEIDGASTEVIGILPPRAYTNPENRRAPGRERLCRRSAAGAGRAHRRSSSQ